MIGNDQELAAARGELRDGDARYLMLRDDSLMGMFRRLPEPVRRQAFTALAESLAEHGGRSAARYRAREGEAGDLLATIAERASQLGWGVWRFLRTDSGELDLGVTNSPFASGYGTSSEPVCAAITGMLQAVATHVFGSAAIAEEHECASAGGTICRFTARLRTP